MHQLQQVMMSRSVHLLRMAGKDVLSAPGKRISQRLVVDLQQRSAGGQTCHHQTFISSGRGTVMVPKPGLLQAQPVKAAKCSMANIAEEGVGTHKPSAFQKRTLVLAKMYPSVDKVPERVTRNQLAVAMDKFRVRACIIMVAVTFIAAAIVAMVGRRERQQGKTLASLAEARKRS